MSETASCRLLFPCSLLLLAASCCPPIISALKAGVWVSFFHLVWEHLARFGSCGYSHRAVFPNDDAHTACCGIMPHLLYTHTHTLTLSLSTLCGLVFVPATGNSVKLNYRDTHDVTVITCFSRILESIDDLEIWANWPSSWPPFVLHSHLLPIQIGLTNLICLWFNISLEYRSEEHTSELQSR